MADDDFAPLRARRQVTMQRTSLVVSVLAVVCLLAGLALTASSEPERFGTATGLLGAPTQSPAASWLMLTGVVLFSLLPGIRVLIALVYYARARHKVEVVVAAIVLTEIVVSMITGA